MAVGRLIPAGTGSPHLKNIIVENPDADSNASKEVSSDKESVEAPETAE